jgi:hypothetical protein
MDGIVKNGQSLSYVKQKWTDFGAAWKRRPDNRKIPHEVSESVYYVRLLSLSSYFASVDEAESSY